MHVALHCFAFISFCTFLNAKLMHFWIELGTAHSAVMQQQHHMEMYSQQTKVYSLGKTLSTHHPELHIHADARSSLQRAKKERVQLNIHSRVLSLLLIHSLLFLFFFFILRMHCMIHIHTSLD